MENVVQALIMAAGVLVGIMVLSVMVLFFNKAGSMNMEYDLQLSADELDKYNSKFEEYNRTGNTFQDIISVINLVWDTNYKNGYSPNNCIKLDIQCTNASIPTEYSDYKRNFSVIPLNALPKGYIYKKKSTDADGTTDKMYIYENKFMECFVKYKFKCTDCTYSTEKISYGKVNYMRFEIE